MPLPTLSRALLATLGLLSAHVALAAGEAQRIVGFIGNPATVTLYADAQGSKVVGKQAVSELRLPLTVLRDENEFVQVRIGNGTVWLDGAQATIERGVEGDCKPAPAGSSKPVAVAATRGAARDCR